MANIYDLITKESQKHAQNYPATDKYLRIRLENLLRKLSMCAYDINHHGIFTQDMVNKYGLLNGIPDPSTLEGAWINDAGTLRLLIGRALRRSEDEMDDMLVILDSLCLLAHEDKKPLIIW